MSVKKIAAIRLLRSKIEPYVPTRLAERLGKPFRSESLQLSGIKDGLARHEVDAVSEDRKIVCGIETASWRRSSGKRGVKKIQGASVEFHFLSLVEADQKYLVLTDPEFYENLKSDTRGKRAPGIDLLHCELPEDLEREVDAIRTASRRELRRQDF